uniref:Uncharacterized protein n=1 Tax=Siphoviridae sp. cti6K1 TaxID=2825620 RepID=A0A8S5UAR7_9CAUD|nr:MAG TPA: hypothetical protein [Siphoviridae sp. cti6K1]
MIISLYYQFCYYWMKYINPLFGNRLYKKC